MRSQSQQHTPTAEHAPALDGEGEGGELLPSLGGPSSAVAPPGIGIQDESRVLHENSSHEPSAQGPHQRPCAPPSSLPNRTSRALEKSPSGPGMAVRVCPHLQNVRNHRHMRACQSHHARSQLPISAQASAAGRTEVQGWPQPQETGGTEAPALECHPPGPSPILPSGRDRCSLRDRLHGARGDARPGTKVQ